MKEQDDSSAGVGLSLIIPAYNEEGCLEKVVQAACAAAEDDDLEEFEILVVDDGSIDATGSVAEAVAGRDSRVRVLHHPARRGLGEALRTGYQSASLEYVTWLPADGQFDMKDSLRLLRSIGEADIVISDVRPVSRIRADSLGKLLLSKGLRIVSRALVRGLTTYSGLLLFRRRVLDKVALTGRTGVVNFELIHKALKSGYTVKRAGFYVAVAPRMAGRSKVANLRTIMGHFLEIIRMRLSCK